MIVSPPPAPDAGQESVAADGWFPPIVLADIRAAVRLGEGTVSNQRLVAAIEGGMLHAFRELAAWRTARAVEGCATLAAVTLLTLNGRNRAVVLWERIVRALAAAELAEEYRDVSATERGLDVAADKADTADEYRRIASAAVADLLSIGSGEVHQRNRVELI